MMMMMGGGFEGVRLSIGVALAYTAQGQQLGP